MAEMSVQTQPQPQTSTRERPKFYDMIKIKEQLEEFVKFHEETCLELNGNKGYIRELMSNDDYAFGVFVSVMVLERAKPKLRYYYEVFKDKHFTPQEIDDLTSTTDYMWWHKVPISEVLAVGNL